MAYDIPTGSLYTKSIDLICRAPAAPSFCCAIGLTTDTAITLAFPTVSGYSYSPGLIIGDYDVAATAGKVQVTDYAGTGVYFSAPQIAAGAVRHDLDKVLLPISTGMKVTIGATTGSTAKGTINAYPFLAKP